MKVVIVGAGVIGLATAYELSKAGHEVSVLEAGAYGQGPSHGNAALATCVLSFPVPAPGTIGIALRSLVSGNQAVSITPRPSVHFLAFLLRMAWATRTVNFAAGTRAQEILSQMVRDGFTELIDDGLAFEHHDRGSLHVFSSRKAFDDALAVFQGFPEIRERVKVLYNAAAVHEVDPTLAPGVRYGYFAPDDLQVEPASLMAALVAAIAKAGGQISENSPVTGFRTAGDRVTSVVTQREVLDADQVVIAAGVASRGLAAKLGYSLPLASGGGYSADVHFDDPSLQPHTSIITDSTHIAVTPLDWGLRVSSGMIIGQREPEVSQPVIDGLLTDLAEVYPSVPLDDVDPGWAGLRPMSADGVPIIGAVPGWRNAYLATGHAMLGLTYAQPTAKVVRRLIDGDAPDDYAVFSPTRFHGRHDS